MSQRKWIRTSSFSSTDSVLSVVICLCCESVPGETERQRVISADWLFKTQWDSQWGHSVGLQVNVFVAETAHRCNDLCGRSYSRACHSHTVYVLMGCEGKSRRTRPGSRTSGRTFPVLEVSLWNVVPAKTPLILWFHYSSSWDVVLTTVEKHICCDNHIRWSQIVEN